MQEERAEVLWRALERAIPDVRQRTELCMVGTPLTHERFLRRHRGSYGPAISAATGSFPGPQTSVQGLYRCISKLLFSSCRLIYLLSGIQCKPQSNSLALS